jgi:hypothetical protein
MSEAVHVSPAQPFSASRAVLAGLLATVAITVSLAMFGQNIMKMLGSMMLPDASVGTQYAVGGAVHLMVGLFYGLVYAGLFGKVREWGPVLKGAVFGLAITAVALAAMPVMAAMLGGGGAAGSPCGGAAKQPANPCNPCAGKQAGNPCNPCAGKTAANPCNPCAGKRAGNPCNPCAGKQAANPCGGAKGPCSGAGNACNPCGGGGPYSGAISAFNHLIYAFVLALVYRSQPAA